jgi:hypothetical protein
VILSKYVGWGGLANAFDQRKAEWAKEFAELKELLTEEEYASARGSTLNAHYTDISVIKAMYDGLKGLGFTGGRMLEPSAGVGNFVGAMPADMTSQVRSWTMVELDGITGLNSHFNRTHYRRVVIGARNRYRARHILNVIFIRLIDSDELIRRQCVIIRLAETELKLDLESGICLKYRIRKMNTADKIAYAAADIGVLEVESGGSDNRIDLPILNRKARKRNLHPGLEGRIVSGKIAVFIGNELTILNTINRDVEIGRVIAERILFRLRNRILGDEVKGDLEIECLIRSSHLLRPDQVIDVVTVTKGVIAVRTDLNRTEIYDLSARKLANLPENRIGILLGAEIAFGTIICNILNICTAGKRDQRPISYNNSTCNIT